MGEAGMLEWQPYFADGLSHFQAGRYREAAACFERVLELKHDHADAHLDLGLAQQRLGRREEAADCYAMALHFRPDFAEAHFNLGVLDLERGAIEAAAAVFEKALRLRPDYAEALSNLGYLQFKYLGRASQGEQNLKRALGAQPGFPDALCNLGMLFQEQGRWDEALAAYDEAVRHDPQLQEARLNRALLWLARGDFTRGWPEYEMRKTGSTHFTPRGYPYPEWDGTPAPDRTLLVYGEQGLGDEIMFASCLPDVIARSGRVVIDWSPKLEKIFERSFPSAVVHGGPQRDADPAWLSRVGRIDFQVAIGSLPMHFRRSGADFQRSGGYLKADTAKTNRWRTVLHGLGAGPKIGISWRGGTAQTRHQLRSIDLEQWAPLLRLPNAHFISLQYHDVAEEIALVESRHRVRVHQWPDAIDEYDETAALVAALDLSVSVQTAVAHLAGALDKPAWVMVPASPEWRYMVEGDTLPWYPSLRLFRQAAAGDWLSVIERVTRELQRSTLR